MYKTITISIISFITVTLLSCTRTLDEIPGGEEIVNGFTVRWRKDVSESKKQVIKEILGDMIFVQGGLFLMGATIEQEPYAMDNERPAHYVKLSDYYIGKYEITAEQVEILTGITLSDIEKKQDAPRYKWKDWERVIMLIQDYAGISMDFPTEAQWEYAARGGVNGNGYVYPGSDVLIEAIWNDNELGVYDMAGYHSEWCKDAYTDYSDFPFTIDPYFAQGQGHVVRGGNMKSEKDQMDRHYHSYPNFFGYYDCTNCCRVSSRSYYEDYDLSSLYSYISCRFVINIQ